MKTTISTVGSQGDVQPYLAPGLMKAGHAVTLAADKIFEPLVLDHQLQYAYLIADPLKAVQVVEDRLISSDPDHVKAETPANKR